jgi:hypothetical protein
MPGKSLQLLFILIIPLFFSQESNAQFSWNVTHTYTDIDSGYFFVFLQFPAREILAQRQGG